MLRGSKGESRAADVIGNAVKVMQVAASEDHDELSHKNPNAVAFSACDEIVTAMDEVAPKPGRSKTLRPIESEMQKFQTETLSAS